jgi:hypothetical protein
VLYDALASEELRTLAPAARWFFVGKRACRSRSPRTCSTACWSNTRGAGLRVVRLKCGDPYVFGRGGEEALALARAGIPFEIVPGVSSAVAAPALAGIPVTHRGLASSFAGRHRPPRGDLWSAARRPAAGRADAGRADGARAARAHRRASAGARLVGRHARRRDRRRRDRAELELDGNAGVARDRGHPGGVVGRARPAGRSVPSWVWPRSSAAGLSLDLSTAAAP